MSGGATMLERHDIARLRCELAADFSRPRAYPKVFRDVAVFRATSTTCAI